MCTRTCWCLYRPTSPRCDQLSVPLPTCSAARVHPSPPTAIRTWAPCATMDVFVDPRSVVFTSHGRPPFLPLSCSQMTVEDVAPHLNRQRPGLPNQAPSDMGERARSLMRSQRRCESLPAFRQAVRALVDAAYPSWFAEAFVADEQDTPPPPLRPCERLGDPERGS